MKKNATSPSQHFPEVRYNVTTSPKVVVKTIELSNDGTLSKSPGGKIPRGSTITTEQKPLNEYVAQVFHGGTRQYAVPSNANLGKDIPIGAKTFAPPGGVDRTKSTLTYTDGPAAVILDHDPSPHAKRTFDSPTAFVDTLHSEFPACFSKAAYCGYHSSGSNIYDKDGNELAGTRGFHVVFAVANAQLIPGFGEIMFARLWLKGYGYIHISVDGRALPRTIFDLKVLESQQPVFAGGAQCVNCEQRRPDPIYLGGEYLDVQAMAPLTLEERREYDRLVAEAKERAKPECEARRQAYLNEHAKQLSERMNIYVSRATRIVQERLNGNLTGCDRLVFDDLGDVSVADVLADPSKYHEATLQDPVEGGAPNKAICYWHPDSGRVIVFSHAHGGMNYYLKHDLHSVLAALDTMSSVEATDQWKTPLMYAQLAADELDQYLTKVKDKTGIGKTALKRAAEELRRNQRANAADMLGDGGDFIAALLLEREYCNGRHLIKTGSGIFWEYVGTHWAQVEEGLLSARLQKIVQDEWPHLRAMWSAQGKKQLSMASVVSSALACLGNRVIRPGDPLMLMSPRKAIINCANGELHLTNDDPVLKPHSPDSFLTSCSPVSYDEDAKAPLFLRLLRGILSLPGGAPMADQDDMIRYVIEILGYLIQSGRWLKAFFLIVGPGDDGKTTLLKVVSVFLGSDAVAHVRIDELDPKRNRFATANIAGKLVIIDDDVDHESLLPDGLLKKVSEEKPLTAEQKFKGAFTFVSQAAIVMLANSWPRTRDISGGMQTRANVIYLPRQFKKPGLCEATDPDRQRPDLWAKVFAEEMSGVLNMLVEGFYRLKQRGSFLPPPSAQQAFTDWINDANVVARFVEDTYERCDSNYSEMTTTDCYRHFVNWSDDNGVQAAYRPTARQIGKRLGELGIRVEHSNRGTSIYGLRRRAVGTATSNDDLPKRPRVHPKAQVKRIK